MSASEHRPLRTRVALRCARWLLWPVARVSPRSGWARLYQRLRGVERDGAPPTDPGGDGPKDPGRLELRKLMAPRGVLAVLLCAAFALWLRDVLRRPSPPVPAARTERSIPRSFAPGATH